MMNLFNNQLFPFVWWRRSWDFKFVENVHYLILFKWSSWFIFMLLLSFWGFPSFITQLVWWEEPFSSLDLVSDRCTRFGTSRCLNMLRSQWCIYILQLASNLLVVIEIGCFWVWFSEKLSFDLSICVLFIMCDWLLSNNILIDSFSPRHFLIFMNFKNRV